MSDAQPPGEPADSGPHRLGYFIVRVRRSAAPGCGELVPAAPDLGSRCDPATLFGSLPARYDLSLPSGAGGSTDIMSIPPSVTRRAYQAAAAGAVAPFFYVRRFISNVGASLADRCDPRVRGRDPGDVPGRRPATARVLGPDRLHRDRPAYDGPPWLAERAGGRSLRWRVLALDGSGSVLRGGPWRRLGFAPAP